jgi:hypothetical protein
VSKWCIHLSVSHGYDPNYSIIATMVLLPVDKHIVNTVFVWTLCLCEHCVCANTDPRRQHLDAKNSNPTPSDSGSMLLHKMTVDTFSIWRGLTAVLHTCEWVLEINCLAHGAKSYSVTCVQRSFFNYRLPRGSNFGPYEWTFAHLFTLALGVYISFWEMIFLKYTQ